MSKIDIDVNAQEILDQLAELMKADPNPVSVAVNSLADRVIVRVLKDELKQDVEWRRSLMRTAQDALKGVPSALAFLRDKDSYLWIRALSDYLDDGGRL
jgi:hypothetical protein